MDNSKITENSIYEKYVSVLLDGRYKIEKLLGTGGMAVVFRAHDMKQDDTVAIKMLRDDIAGDPEALTRFVNESRAVSMLAPEHCSDTRCFGRYRAQISRDGIHRRHFAARLYG